MYTRLAWLANPNPDPNPNPKKVSLHTDSRMVGLVGSGLGLAGHASRVYLRGISIHTASGETSHTATRLIVCIDTGCEYMGGAEIASIRKHKYGKPKYKSGHFTSMENASMEHASTDVHGWNTQVRKSQVRI